jgi:hypothetical protein
MRAPPLGDAPGFRILSWNVAGLRALLKKVHGRAGGLHALHMRPGAPPRGAHAPRASPQQHLPAAG